MLTIKIKYAVKRKDKKYEGNHGQKTLVKRKYL